MSAEMKDTLNDSTISAVRELVQINLDSAKGYQQAADLVELEALGALFKDISRQRTQQADELQALLVRNDYEPISRGSVMARLHRAVVACRSTLGGGVDALVDEIQRGEAYIKAKYEVLLTRTAGSAATDLLHEQYAAVVRAYQYVEELSIKFETAN